MKHWDLHLEDFNAAYHIKDAQRRIRANQDNEMCYSVLILQYKCIHCFCFHVSSGRDFGKRASKTLHCASHFSAFYIHPRCEDDSSQLWQREDNVLQLPERTAVGFIWAGCSFYSEARSIISWRKPGIPAPLHHIRAILIPISITLHVTSFMSPCCGLNSKL